MHAGGLRTRGSKKAPQRIPAIRTRKLHVKPVEASLLRTTGNLVKAPLHPKKTTVLPTVRERVGIQEAVRVGNGNSCVQELH